MNKYTYIITIDSNNGNVNGKLQVLGHDDKLKSVTFNPELILCDLINSNKVLKIEDDKVSIEYYEYEKSFGIDLYVYDDPQYWKFREELIEVIHNKKKIEIKDLDKINDAYKIKANCEISNRDTEIFQFKKLNGEFTKGLTDEQAERIKNIYDVLKDETLDIMEECKNSDKEIPEEKKKELDDLYNKFDTSSKESIKIDYDNMVEQLDASIEEQIKFDNDFVYTYTCYSVGGILYCILHYLMANNYRFLKCPHCENYFATKKRNAKYCNRKSKLKGYENKDCATAKRLAFKKLKKRENNVLSYLENYCASSPKVIKKFKTVCEKTLIKAENEPTIKNIEKLNHILDRKYVKENYYIYKDKTIANILKEIGITNKQRYIK